VIAGQAVVSGVVSEEAYMSRLVPNGFLTFRQAAAKIEDALFAGTPDQAAVVKARSQMGADIGDRDANRAAIDELWKSVDAAAVRPVVIGGAPRRVVKLDPALTRAIPFLRRTGDFTLLRPRNAHYAEITGWFGVHQIANITLAFRESDVGKLCSRLRQTRRRKARSSGGKRGRPTIQALIRPCIVEAIDQGKWNTTGSMKALTLLVGRTIGTGVSEDSVTRALDKLYAETLDRRFSRHRKSRQR
jgi:hypothetical protein